MPKKAQGPTQPQSNGGIMGSGIFGLFGTTIQCPASDTSIFCTFMKFFNVLIVSCIIIFILYTIYTMFISPYFNKRR